MTSLFWSALRALSAGAGSEASCLAIFDDFGDFVLTARTLKRAFVVVGLVRFYARKPHQRAASRTFRMRDR